MFKKIKDLEIYPASIFKEKWSQNELSKILNMLPTPSHLFCYLRGPSDWKQKLIREAMELGRSTVIFVDPPGTVEFKLILEYEGEGEFKYMNMPECFYGYDGPMKFKVDEKHLKLFLSHTLMDYRNINIKPKAGYQETVLPELGAGWGKTLKATTTFINRLYDVSEGNIIIALKKLCEYEVVTHAGLNFVMDDCSKAIINVSRSNSKYYRPHQVVIDNNVIDEIIAAPMPVIKKKPKKRPEFPLFDPVDEELGVEEAALLRGPLFNFGQ